MHSSNKELASSMGRVLVHFAAAAVVVAAAAAAGAERVPSGEVDQDAVGTWHTVAVQAVVPTAPLYSAPLLAVHIPEQYGCQPMLGNKK